jgi:hypothetical protein
VREFSLVLEAIRHQDELALGPATNRGEEAGRAATFRIRQRLHPRLDFRFRCAGRIEVCLFRLLRRARNKRLVVIEARPRSLVDQEVVEAGAAKRRCIRHQIQQHRLVALPHLAKEQRVEYLAGFHDFGQRLSLILGQRGDVRGEIRGRVPPRHRLESLGFGVGGR